MPLKAGSKQYGPFEVVDIVQPDVQTLVTIPYSDVVGSQMLVTVSDNFARDFLLADNASRFAAAEIGITGRVQGEPYIIQRAHVRALSGPLRWIFRAEEMYDQIEIGARNMSGGRRGSPSTDFAVGLNFTGASGFSILVNVSIQPVQRSVIGPEAYGHGWGG